MYKSGLSILIDVIVAITVILLSSENYSTSYNEINENKLLFNYNLVMASPINATYPKVAYCLYLPIVCNCVCFGNPAGTDGIDANWLTEAVNFFKPHDKNKKDIVSQINLSMFIYFFI